jgi:polar amino acid transport system permease protein
MAACSVKMQFRKARRLFRPSPLIDVAKFLLLAAALTWLMVRGSEKLGYNWQWYRVPRYIATIEDGRAVVGPLLEGLIVTCHITSVSLPIAFVFSLTAALFRLSRSPVARSTARCYLEFIRNTPLLVQLFFIYFVLSPILQIDRFSSAVLALAAFEGAYGSEIIRAGIVSIHRGQWEAAYSLGMGGYHTYRYIILPQAFRRILPPLASQAISLIKDSALVSTVAIYDLTMQGQAIIAETYLTFEIWFTIAAIYLTLTLAVSLIIHFMENRLRGGTPAM